MAFRGIFSDPETELSSYGAELINLGLCYYFVLLMSVSANSVTGVSISAERGNFALLKTLPVSGKDVVLSKVKVAMVLSALISAAFLIPYLCVTSLPLQPLFGVLLSVCFFASGVGISAWEIMRDLENPTFNFTNINELTRNNKKLMKPMFLTMGVGLVGMVAGIVFGAVLSEKYLYLGYILFFLLAFTVSGLMLYLPMNSMSKRVEELYEKEM